MNARPAPNLCRECETAKPGGHPTADGWLCHDCADTLAKEEAARNIASRGVLQGSSESPHSLPAGSSLVSGSASVSGSLVSPTGPREGEPEGEWLYRTAAHREIVPVALPPIPHNAPKAVCDVADFYRRMRGLWLGVGNDRPIPFACGWVAEKLGLSKMTVWRALKWLEAHGVLVQAGELPQKDKSPMHLWAPGEVRGADLHAIDGGVE